MPRGRSIPKRKQQPDPRYSDTRVTKFINYIMVEGKKDKAKNLVYQSLEKAGQKVGLDPLVLLEKSLDAVRPDVEVRSRRVGGANYQIPVPVARSRGDFLAMKWIIKASRSRKGKSMIEKLASELINAFNGEGDAVKKKEDTHRMADANKAFAHFRW